MFYVLCAYGIYKVNYFLANREVEKNHWLPSVCGTESIIMYNSTWFKCKSIKTIYMEICSIRIENIIYVSYVSSIIKFCTICISHQIIIERI